jgi:hypothetical protein
MMNPRATAAIAVAGIALAGCGASRTYGTAHAPVSVPSPAHDVSPFPGHTCTVSDKLDAEALAVTPTKSKYNAEAKNVCESSRQLCNAQLRPTYPRRRYQRVRRPGRDDSTKAGILFAWCRPIWATAAVKLGGRPFGELGPALAWRDDVRENGGALDGVRALPAKERTSRSAAASAGRWDILLGQRRVPPYAAPRRRFARRLSVRSGRHRQRQGDLTPCRF